MVILITGRPSAGKTTTAYEIKRSIFDNTNTIILDGDELRDAWNYNDYTKEGRTKWMLDIASLAKVLENQGLNVIISLVSPLRDVRKQMLEMFKESVLLYIKGKEECMWTETNNNCSVYEEPNDGDGADTFVIRKGYEDGE